MNDLVCSFVIWIGCETYGRALKVIRPLNKFVKIPCAMVNTRRPALALFSVSKIELSFDIYGYNIDWIAGELLP